MTHGHRTRRLQAAESAYQLLTEAGIDPTCQVDVYGLCERLGLWLVFLPLDRLLGAFIRKGAGGVLITTERPTTVQRYTAAHELGHWRLGHETPHSFDEELQILGTTADDETEHLAQIFAAALLMPPPLVFQTLDRLGVKPDDVSAIDAYTVAREAGVSYEAAVRQLANLAVIGHDRVSTLLNTTPLEIKTMIGRGQRPITGHADVWPVDEDWHGQELNVRIDDELIISLSENRSTGYRWAFAGQEIKHILADEPAPLHMAQASAGANALKREHAVIDHVEKIGVHPTVSDRVSDIIVNDTAKQPMQSRNVELGNGAAVVADRYLTPRSPVAPEYTGAHQAELSLFTDASISRLSLPDGLSEPPLVGASGQRVLAVRFRRSGCVALRLNYESPYNDSGPAEEFCITAHVEPLRSGFSAEQIALATEDSLTIATQQAQPGTIAPESQSETTDPRS